MTLAEIPGYEELQTVADAAQGRNDVLELGTGTGETAFVSWRGTPAKLDRDRCSSMGVS